MCVQNPHCKKVFNAEIAGDAEIKLMKEVIMVFERKRFLVFILCVLGSLCVPITAQDFKTLKPGVEYAKVRRDFGGKLVNIDLLRLDLARVRLDVHHANSSAIGTETTSSIAKRNRAFAAINAGFFRLDRTPFAGDPVGLFMIDGNPLSEPTNGRIQLIINNRAARTDVQLARTDFTQTVTLGNEIFDVSGINRERRKDDLVIYTPEFGRTTQTANEGIELVVIKGVITAVLKDVGGSVIPVGGYVISASGTFRGNLEGLAKTAETVTLTRKWEGLPPEFSRDRNKLDVVTGIPQLIRNGTIDITWEQEKSSKAFVETRHPRTAVAKLKNGKLLFLTADGRTEESGGLGLEDLAAYFLELGAVDAMNLDGGGSTTMFVNGKVVNKPSDKEGERKVSDALLVTLRRKR